MGLPLETEDDIGGTYVPGHQTAVEQKAAAADAETKSDIEQPEENAEPEIKN